MHRLSSPPTCPGPQLLRFHAYVGADKSGKLNFMAADASAYGSYNVVGCYGIYVEGKNVEDSNWQTIDEILDVIKWIADGWYEGEDTRRDWIGLVGDDTPVTLPEPFGRYSLEKRRSQISEQESEPFSELPRLIRFSTPNTYSSNHRNAWMPIKIDTRYDEDVQWNTSPGGADYWCYVLDWFQDGLYKIKDEQYQVSCVFERV